MLIVLRALKVSLALFLSFGLVACGGGSSSSAAPVTEQPARPAACMATLPPQNTDPNRPIITLNGSRVVSQAVGSAYVDPGAIAADPQEGDITSRIVVRGVDQVNVSSVGDYLVRYNVSNARSSAADEVVRIVRVNSGTFAKQTAREWGTTSAVMGYFEHLPVNYSEDAAKKFPVIIHNHGIGEDADFLQNDTDVYAYSQRHLDYLLRRGLSGIIDHGKWDDSRPFVVLSPQRCADFPDSFIESFVQYAVRTYNVDPTRIYMTGFSAGSWITWEHIRLNPNELAAAVTISGGDSASSVAGCVMKDTPTWSFHASDDKTVPVEDTINTVSAIRACNPTKPHKLTIFPSGGHLIDINTLELTLMGTGTPNYDPYDQDIYSWLLQFTRP